LKNIYPKEETMNETVDQTQDLLIFFKALADENRLKIVGLLSKEDLSVEQIAEMLKVSPSTISHHLSKLTKARLVSARPVSYYNIYHLETKVLENMSKKLLAKDTLPTVSADIDMDAYDRKVVKNYSHSDGTLKAIPPQQKKLLAILKFIIRDFEFDQRYSEKEVNEILVKYHEDYARLRRELVNFKFMGREGGGGQYWRLENK
jgi:predicted transcriptional regulator